MNEKPTGGTLGAPTRNRGKLLLRENRVEVRYNDFEMKMLKEKAKKEFQTVAAYVRTASLRFRRK